MPHNFQTSGTSKSISTHPPTRRTIILGAKQLSFPTSTEFLLLVDLLSIRFCHSWPSPPTPICFDRKLSFHSHILLFASFKIQNFSHTDRSRQI